MARCTTSLLRRLAWEQVVLPWRARAHDVVYMVGNFALFGCPRPQVLCAQNAIYFTDAARAVRRQGWPMRGRMRLALESLVARLSIRRADRVVAVSRTMRAAIEGDLGRLPQVRVVRSATPRMPEALSAPRPDRGAYVLSVAHDIPHKDWDGLIEAFLKAPDLPRLLIAGDAGPSRQAALHTRCGARVELLGPVWDRRRLAALYEGAGCVVVHSLVESFGLTVAESKGYGVPTVAADIPAHREVGDDRVLYYAPGDSEALAATVRQALGHRGAPAEATGDGWTWEDNARELRDLLFEAAG